MEMDHRSVGLSDSEYSAIVEALGRQPNQAELRILGVMWSEHCSYKSTRRLLAGLPTKGDFVVLGPGENAGVVDIGGGWGVAFKLESHNHPSAVAPYDGAATGVGGIVRDVLAMGARPVALLNGLCLGRKDSPQAAETADGIVEGIAGYGNTLGVPTIGGKTVYDECFDFNPLVNAMCLGLVPLGGIVSSKTAKPGHRAVLIGSRTGKEGVAGAAFASSELIGTKAPNLPRVPKGDPLLEKRLIEGCLEIHSKGLIVAMQDMGAAGIVSSSSEIASKSGTGILVNVDLVPLKEKMEPWEIALSETQERMLLIVKKEDLGEIGAIAAKWRLDWSVIGEITGDGDFVMTREGRTVVNLPAEMVGGGSPPIHWPSKKPSAEKTLEAKSKGSLDPEEVSRSLAAILEDPNLADKSGIFGRFDSGAQSNTVTPPGKSVSIFRVRENGNLVVVTMEADPWKCQLEPFLGTAETFLKCLRPLWVSGAAHLGMTNCLNFPSPEDPENFWVLERSVLGLSVVGGDLACPVVSGNVSLYNESPDGKILASPLVAVVGLLEEGKAPLADAAELEAGSVFLVGEEQGFLGGSAYSRIVDPAGTYTAGPYNPSKERAFMERAHRTAREEAAAAGRALAGGGLLVALAKICRDTGIGISLDAGNLDLSTDRLFGEWGARAVYLVPEGSTDLFLSCWEGFPARRIGKITGGVLALEEREIYPGKTPQEKVKEA
ncbi:MAG: Phosphoribosylformylglycinamidine synthase 2 [Synergistetes bacterium ADurb.Bin155]|nr:MAG: Phosphoribosylformylglycinamidine synthase 2 [Synergistetes bacterium ADurb.Bin155]